MSILSFVKIKQREVELLPTEEMSFRLLAAMQGSLETQYTIWTITRSQVIIHNITESLNIVRALLRCYELPTEKRFPQLMMALYKKDIRMFIKSYQAPRGSTDDQKKSIHDSRQKVQNDLKMILTSILQDTEAFTLPALLEQLHLDSTDEVREMVRAQIKALEQFDLRTDLINDDLIINENPLVM